MYLAHEHIHACKRAHDGTMLENLKVAFVHIFNGSYFQSVLLLSIYSFHAAPLPTWHIHMNNILQSLFSALKNDSHSSKSIQYISKILPMFLPDSWQTVSWYRKWWSIEKLFGAQNTLHMYNVQPTFNIEHWTLNIHVNLTEFIFIDVIYLYTDGSR